GNTAKGAARYDVIVVGAGPGGVAASIQAAKMGQHVALLEETDWVGGQMTAAGVGTMDEDSLSVRQSGLYKDFADRAASYYKAQGKSTSTCYFGPGHLCVDPKVGQDILRQMLGDAGPNLDLQTRVQITQVLKQDNRVTGVVAKTGQTYQAKVVIDA